jgi:UDP-N-acetylmuramoyl-L-alanyl-D-glutamate--2,6-diaminopimelate ligase
MSESQPSAKTLAQLIEALPNGIVTQRINIDPAPRPIHKITMDSRKVQSGDVFVAYRGVESDGHKYIGNAIEHGAAAIVCEQLPPQASSVPIMQVRNGREAFAWLCAAQRDFPSRALTLIGVTGTDGKTTTSTLLFNILKAASLKTGLISTVSAVIGDENYDTGLHTTTPDADDVQRYLAQMRDAGTTHCVLETTSHGTAQYRVDGCEFDLAVITNITQDHLDFHGTREAYRAAKARLFEMSPRVVLNADDAYSFDHLRAIPNKQRWIYSASPESVVLPESTEGNVASAYPALLDRSAPDMRPSTSSGRVYASDIRHDADGMAFVLHSSRGAVELRSSLIGDYNVSNILAAATTALALDVPTSAIQQGIAQTRAVPGRMERIDAGQAFTAIVDFAHTPNALANALQALRRITQKRLIVVFGCAGERDAQKRPLMGEAAARLADVVIVTAEDPRRESLDAIMAQIDIGIARANSKSEVHHVPDRGEAIALACSLARVGDVVVACGKGHEQSMCFGTIEYAWDDRVAMRQAIERGLERDSTK